MNDNDNAPLSLKEVRRLLNISRVALDWHVRRHRMPVKKDASGRVRIDADALEAWMQSMRYTLPAVGAFLARREGKPTFQIIRTVTTKQTFSAVNFKPDLSKRVYRPTKRPRRAA